MSEAIVNGMIPEYWLKVVTEQPFFMGKWFAHWYTFCTTHILSHRPSTFMRLFVTRRVMSVSYKTNKNSGGFPSSRGNMVLVHMPCLTLVHPSCPRNATTNAFPGRNNLSYTVFFFCPWCKIWLSLIKVSSYSPGVVKRIAINSILYLIHSHCLSKNTRVSLFQHLFVDVDT